MPSFVLTCCDISVRRLSSSCCLALTYYEFVELFESSPSLLSDKAK